MDKSLQEFQIKVIEKARICLDNASSDGQYGRIPSENIEELGEALKNLADAEERRYRQYFLSETQAGLNSAQVLLQRLEMNQRQLEIEKKIDAADQLYLSFFDSKLSGGHYLCHSSDGVRFIELTDLKKAKEALSLIQKEN